MPISRLRVIQVIAGLIGVDVIQRPPRPTVSEHPGMVSFEDAFGGCGSGCASQCACGRIFYNSDGGWDFEMGELERYRANPNATDLVYGVGHIEFEGTVYVWDCDCWRPRAVQIIRFITSHGRQIAEFLTLERERKVAAAESSPTVTA